MINESEYMNLRLLIDLDFDSRIVYKFVSSSQESMKNSINNECASFRIEIVQYDRITF